MYRRRSLGLENLSGHGLERGRKKDIYIQVGTFESPEKLRAEEELKGYVKSLIC